MPKPFLRRFAKKFFIFCNILVVILTLLGANVKYFNPSDWWFIGLLALCLPYFIIVLIIFLVFWLFTKPLYTLISLVAIAFSWTAIQNIFPLNFSPEFRVQKDSGNIRIMSWNVEHFDILEHKIHPETKEKMLELINKYKPDIACFQEMVAGDKVKSVNKLEDIKNVLQFKDYHYVYDNIWNFDVNHHFGIIIFSNLPVINRQMISWPPHNYNSVFQYDDVIAANDTIRIFNIHLQSLRFGQSTLQYLNDPTINYDSDILKSRNVVGKLKKGFIKRGIQATNVKNELNKSPFPFVVCGDFNDVPYSYAYSVIGAGLQNAFVTKGTGFGRTFSGISPTLRIDNIFVDKRFTVQQFTRIPKKLSDHFPIIADIHLNDK